jgi:ATP-dependent helicase/nuclease subunit B
MFPALSEMLPGSSVELPGFGRETEGVRDMLSLVSDPAGVAAVAARLAGSGSPGHLKSYRRLACWLAESGFREATGFIRRATRPNAEPPLVPGAAAKLFGSELDMSVSRLESFSACPFQHFARYGLGLRERRSPGLDPSIAGLFMHHVLMRFIKRSISQGLDISLAVEAEVKDAITDAATEALHEFELSGLRLDRSSQAEMDALTQSLKAAALVLVEHARRGRFRPVAAEVSFGTVGDLALPVIRTRSGIRANLVGRIDYVDAATDQGETYFRVIDFKSTKSHLDIEDVEDGLDLQLAGYTYALLERGAVLLGRAPTPAAMLYFGLRESFARVATPPGDPREAEAQRLRGRRMSGLVTSDPAPVRLMDRFDAPRSDLVPVALGKDGRPARTSSVVPPEELCRLARRFYEIACSNAERIAAGDVSIAPYRRRAAIACLTCGFGVVCQFDSSRPENRYRSPRSLPSGAPRGSREAAP